MKIGNINVIRGYMALAIDKQYWIGIAYGNRVCTKRRRKPEKAIEDAYKLDFK